jgi:hypothetical protein
MTLPLVPDHQKLLMNDSAILPEVAAERGYYSVDTKDGYPQLKALGFPRAHAKHTPGLCLPLHTPDGQQPLTVYRPDQPYVDGKGDTHKYLLPSNTGVRIDCPPRCLALIKDPTIPLWITEGQRKEDSLASLGAAVIGVLGVWSFKGKNPFGGMTVLADLDYIAFNAGREVRIIYDSDVMVNTKVRAALERLTEHLQRRGSQVRAVYLPHVPGSKTGVDDYLADHHTLLDLEALIQVPRPQAQPAPALVEVLDTAPSCLRKPLALVDGRAYAAIWPYVKVTRTEALDKQGNVVRLQTPEVTTEQRLFLVRDDGEIFGDGGTKPLAELGMTVHLPEIPPPDKLWTAPNVKAYRQGTRSTPGATFTAMVNVIDTFIDFDRSLGTQQTMCEFLACYCLATWFLDAFTVIGYVWPNGEKGSGKTQVLTVVAELGYLGHVLLAGSSYASLRDLADYGATLCFDDAEKVMDFHKGDPEKRALLLAGNRRGNTIAVKEPVNGREWRTRQVQTFCPRCFSAIRLPDPVLASRTIIVPLIRTADPRKANNDPLEYDQWPVSRAELVADLWALALAHGTQLPGYYARVGQATTLLGRNLEPWRAILAVAQWLTDQGVDGLAPRIQQLAHDYQRERCNFEEHDLMPLVIQALCEYAINPTPINPMNPITPINMGSPDDAKIHFLTADITAIVKTLAEAQETGLDPETITAKRVGRVFGKMRLYEVPRPSGKVPPGTPKPSRARTWRATKAILRQWLLAYHMEIPDEFNNCTHATSSLPPLNGVNGVHGVNGGVAAPPSGLGAQPGSANGTEGETVCPHCGARGTPHTESFPDGSTALRCTQCHRIQEVVPF